MTIKADSKRIRADIAATRQSAANARNRAIPRFKHPERPKKGAPKPAQAAEATEPTKDETATPDTEPDA